MKRSEDFYFNLNQAELIEMEYGTFGTFTETVQRIVKTKENGEIIRIFKDLVLKAYGEKSPDGKRFIKSDEIATAFAQTEAYNNLFMELASNADSAAEFINGIVPAELAAEAAKHPELTVLPTA